MANSSAIIFSLAFVAALIISVDAGGDHGVSWVPVRPRCEGSVAEEVLPPTTASRVLRIRVTPTTVDAVLMLVAGVDHAV
ncbi:hypothetical protein DVH24_007553 [Malus domestica]|uniref:Uncharacterized protein n=1 Tax=Malus domestica TaxID=3750 RepID=A0A498HLN4_MALDO|nr:hypothetical protein DVH24_007553 [Malus domestica]